MENIVVLGSARFDTFFSQKSRQIRVIIISRPDLTIGTINTWTPTASFILKHYSRFLIST